MQVSAVETGTRRELVMLVVFLGVMMSAIDSTIVILAIPTITEELHTNLEMAGWLIMGYILVISTLSAQLGRLGDNLGRSNVYNLGFLLFTLGSALCGASPNINVLLLFRLIQALGGAMMQSTSGAVIADHYPPNLRGRAFGYTSIGWNIGSTLGIVLGGFMTTALGWRYIFYINVPIGLIALSLGIKYLKTWETARRKFDILGTIMLGASLILISLGSMEIAGSGLNDASAAMILGGIAIFAIMMVFVEPKQEMAIIDIKAFRNKLLTASILASFFQSMGYISISFVLTMYLQGIRGLSPFQTSLLLVPGYLSASLISPFSGRLSDRIGSRLPATLGIGMMMFSVAIYIATLSPSTPLSLIVLGTLIGGIGSALFYPANNSAIMANASRGYYGGASGIQRTLGNIGMLLSYVMAIGVSSLSMPRELAFRIFMGTSNVIGRIAAGFLVGMRAAFLSSMIILAIALFLSALRGKEVRAEK
ncbi:MAG: MFS transporter [Fervidicoccus sp.]|nr:MAG: MFS transporter [Fervidicoccus sp.]